MNTSPQRFAVWYTAALLTLPGVSAGAESATPPRLELNNPTDAPFTTNTQDGFLDVIVTEAFRRAGLTLTLVQLPAERGLINANDGIEDGDLSRIAGLEQVYPNLVRVPEKLFNMHFVALTRGAALKEATWQNLEPFAVGHIRGWKIFEQNLTPKTHAIAVTTPEQLIEMLGGNRIDVALYSRWMGLAMAQRLNFRDVRVAEPPLAKRDMFIYLHKRHEQHVATIAQALRALKAEGVFTRVCREKFAAVAPPNEECDGR